MTWPVLFSKPIRMFKSTVLIIKFLLFVKIRLPHKRNSIIQCEGICLFPSNKLPLPQNTYLVWRHYLLGLKNLSHNVIDILQVSKKRQNSPFTKWKGFVDLTFLKKVIYLCTSNHFRPPAMYYTIYMYTSSFQSLMGIVWNCYLFLILISAVGNFSVTLKRLY